MFGKKDIFFCGLVGPSLYESGDGALDLLCYLVRRVREDGSNVVELAKTMDLDNLGFLFVGEAGSDPNEDFFSHLIQLFDIVVMHVLEFAIEFYSKEFELLDELNSGVISELEDSGVVDSAKSTYLGFGLVDGET
jgi:hypothetical protein